MEGVHGALDVEVVQVGEEVADGLLHAARALRCLLVDEEEAGAAGEEEGGDQQVVEVVHLPEVQGRGCELQALHHVQGCVGHKLAHVLHAAAPSADPVAAAFAGPEGAGVDGLVLGDDEQSEAHPLHGIRSNSVTCSCSVTCL